jgi:ABC transporter DrrB family efflux protein
MTDIAPTATTPRRDRNAEHTEDTQHAHHTEHTGHTAGATFWAASRETARRTTLQYLRSPQMLVLPTVMVTLFLFIYRYVFGGAITTGSSVDYVHYLVPGFVVTTILWTGMNTPAGVAQDAASGVHDRLRSLPIPRSAVMAGRSLADTALGCWTLSTTTVLGLAVGFRPQGGALAGVAAAALLLTATYTFSWVFIALGLAAGNAQAAQGMASLVVVPLTFPSSAYVPVDSMPGWLQAVAANQPITAVVNAVRSLLLGGSDAAGIGHSTTHWVTLSLVWCAGLLAISATAAVARFTRKR